MTITVEIPSQLEAELAAQAQARGLDVPAYAATVIERAIQPLPKPRRRSLEEFEESLDRIAQLSDKIPILPDEAFTRESMYQDHH